MEALDHRLAVPGVDVTIEIPKVVAGLVVLVLRELHAAATSSRPSLADGGVGRRVRDQLGVTQGPPHLTRERTHHRLLTATAPITSAPRSSTVMPAASPSKLTCRRCLSAGTATALMSSSATL